jgi:hypothetical protein
MNALCLDEKAAAALAYGLELGNLLVVLSNYGHGDRS